MKIHKHLILSVGSALKDIFVERKYADKVIEKSLYQNKKWGARDRRFFAESVYEVVRHYRYLSTILNSLEKVSGDDFINLWAIWFYKTYDEILPEDIASLHWPAVHDLLKKEWPAKIKYSYPDWMDEIGSNSLGDKWSEVALALSSPAKVHLRANSLKITAPELRDQLMAEGIDCKFHKERFKEAVTLSERKNVFSTQSFQKGLFEVQDLSSQEVAPFLRVEPGMRVFDACAGAGGKSLHLAALMKNKGKIISMDIHQWKLDELKKRSKRAGVDIIETRLIEGSKTIKRLAESCDRLLLDVPCSGMGVLRRNPDTKWKLTLEEVNRLQVLQSEILEGYSKMLKKGGLMVYSTCSILPQENELQVQNFLNKHPEFDLIEQLTQLPSEGDWDGFYMAVMSKS